LQAISVIGDNLYCGTCRLLRRDNAAGRLRDIAAYAHLFSRPRQN